MPVETVYEEDDVVERKAATKVFLAEEGISVQDIREATVRFGSYPSPFQVVWRGVFILVGIPNDPSRRPVNGFVFENDDSMASRLWAD